MHFYTASASIATVLTAFCVLLVTRECAGSVVTLDGAADSQWSYTTPFGGEYTWDIVTTLPPATEPPRSEDASRKVDDDGDREVVSLVVPLVDVDLAVPSRSRWVQKMVGRQSERSRAKSLPVQQVRVPAEPATTAVSPATLGRVLATVAYDTPWSVVNANPECAKDVRTYNGHVRNLTLWAAKMLDATSKGPEGILDGNTHSFGNFDQCIGAKSKNYGIAGGYSLVDIDFRPKFSVYPGFYDNDHSKDYDPLDEDKSSWEAIKHKVKSDFVQRHKFQWAVCLPDTCLSEDVQQIVSDTLIPVLNRHGMEGNVSIDPLLHTTNKNVYKYTMGFYITCGAYVLAALLLVAGTLHDLIFLRYRPKSEHGPMKKFMKPFSLISNIERLLKPSETDEFSVINGFKFLAIVQVVFGHRWFLELGSPQSNPDFLYSVLHNLFFGYFACTIFLDTFFIISGFLTFFHITKLLTEKKTFNFFHIMIYRWFRIFPVYGSLIATYIFILPYLNDGPYWKMIVYKESERCQQNWWANILFINNYVNTGELCIIPSWYLACDMHFFIVGTFLTYVIWKWRRPGLVLLWTMFTLSTIIPAYIIIQNRHRGIVSLSPESLKDLSKDRFFTSVYIKSHMRAMSYFIGLFAGYLYLKLKDIDYQFSLKSRIFWAPIAVIVGNLIYLSSGFFFAEKHEYNVYEHVIYFTVGRFVWSIIICYIIICHGRSGLGVCLSGFLGHRFFQVLGKLVFCIYLYQEIIQLQTIGSIRTPTYQSFSLTAWRIGGDVMYSILYGFAINVLFESPFDRLQKNVMKFLTGDNFFSKPKVPYSSNGVIENKSSY